MSAVDAAAPALMAGAAAQPRRSVRIGGLVIGTVVGVSLFGSAVIFAAPGPGVLKVFLLTLFGIAGLALFATLARAGGLARFHLPYVVPGVAMIALYVTGALLNTLGGLEATVQLMLALTYLLFLAHGDWNRRACIVLTLAIGLVIGVNFAVWGAAGFPQRFAGLTPQKNYIGVLTFVSLFLLGELLRAARAPVERAALAAITCMALALMVFCESRSILLSVFAAGFTWALAPWLARSRLLWYGFIFAAFAFFVAFTFVYIFLASTDAGRELNAIMFEASNTNLFSGREFIWPVMLLSLQNDWLFGHGPQVTASTILLRAGFYSELSTHNQYLGIAIQTGVLGVLAFFAVLTGIWSCLRAGAAARDPVVRWSAGFFIGVLLNQEFEMSLTQNNLISGLVLWAIPGIGLARAFTLSRQTPATPRP